MATSLLPLPFDRSYLLGAQPCLIRTRLTILIRSSPGPFEQYPFHQRLFRKAEFGPASGRSNSDRRQAKLCASPVPSLLCRFSLGRSLYMRHSRPRQAPHHQLRPPLRSTASETLKPALVGVLQTLGSLKLDKWKRGSVREEAGSNIDTIQRDLEETLPPCSKPPTPLQPQSARCCL